MVEIAICLAIIGIALVSIIGVLPIGMHTQRDNREETIINQDATILMEDIRNGVKSDNDLTNYVYSITVTWTYYLNGKTNGSGVNGYTYSDAYYSGGYKPPSPPFSTLPINSGTNIIGLLTTPEFQDVNGNTIGDWIPGGLNTGYSNHVVAYVYSMSGPAVEKPPQNNSLMQQGSFAYRVLCENTPVPNPNTGTTYAGDLQNNLYELRLAFFWPQQPNGSLGHGYQTFRTMVAGDIARDYYQTNLYFFQPQTFTSQ